MKYKKQIAMICLITFLFLPFSKHEEPKAEVLTIVLTTGVIMGCAALATMCGVALTGDNIVKDVGYKVYEGIKDIPGAIVNHGENLKFNLNKKVFDTVFDIVKNLPDKAVIGDVLGNVLDVPTFKTTHTFSKARNGIFLLEFKDYSSAYRFNISLGSQSLSFDYDTLKDGENVVEYDQTGVLFNGNYKAWKSTPNSGNLSVWGENFSSVTSCYTKVKNFVSFFNTTLNYNPSVCADLNRNKVKDYIPNEEGSSISIPVDAPLATPSISAPLKSPYDILGADGIVDGIPDVIGDDSVSGDVSIDKPNVDVGETPTTGEGLWDTLLSWLSSLFAPLVALLEWIGTILTSILDFLGSLVSSLVDAIVSLFTPTVAVDELFSIPEGSGFSDILSLFDWGLFDIEPRPYEFVATLDFISLVDNTSNPQVIEIKLFDNELVKKYLPYVRNILSYSLLISTISMIVWHFIPKRDID